MTARMPEPQTLWSVTAPVRLRKAGAEERLARRRLALPGLQDVAHPDVLDARGRNLRALDGATLIATAPSACAGSVESEPRNEPIGVRAAERMKTS